MKLKTIVAATLLGVSSFAANAYIVDLFDAPASPDIQLVQDFSNTTGPVVSQYGTSTSIIGGYRDLIIDATSGASAPVTGSSLYVQNGFLQLDNANGVTSNAAVQWDGDDSGTVAGVGGLNIGGLEGANLIFQEGCGSVGCDRFVASVRNADLGFNYTFGIYTDATHWTVLSSGTLFEVANYETDWLFDWFLLAPGDYVLGGLPFTITQGIGGAADLQNVGAMELTLSNTGTCYQSGLACPAAVDLALSSLTKTVPEPGSMALAGLGLLGLAALRRRKQA